MGCVYSDFFAVFVCILCAFPLGKILYENESLKGGPSEIVGLVEKFDQEQISREKTRKLAKSTLSMAVTYVGDLGWPTYVTFEGIYGDPHRSPSGGIS